MMQPSTKLAVHPGDDTGEHPQPKRALGLRDLALFYVVASLSLRWIPLAAAAGPSSLVMWVVGLVAIFLPLALCVMELSSRYPEEGGMYVWSKHAFGDFSGFLTGWSYWMSNLPFFPSILYFAASNALYVAGDRGKALQTSPTFFLIFSFCGLALALALNIVGLNIAKWLNNVGAIGAWLPVGLLCVVGVIALRRFGSATSFNAVTLRPSLNLGNAGVWATLMFAFAGAESASCMGGEIKDARRIIPRALLIAGVLIAAGYILGTVAVLIVLPQQQLNGMEGIMQAISLSAGRIGWSGLGPAVALLICLANLGAGGAFLAAMSRLPFVAGIDRYLPPAFGRVHPRWRTPHISLIVQGVGVCGLRSVGAIGKQHPQRLSGAGEYEHHHRLRALSVHVCRADSAAARAGRAGDRPHTWRKAGGVRAGDHWLRRNLRDDCRLGGSRSQRTEQGFGCGQDRAAYHRRDRRRRAAVRAGQTKGCDDSSCR